MARQIATVIAENNLNVHPAHILRDALGALIYSPQIIRCRGEVNAGRFSYVTTYGSSEREAVNRWLHMRNMLQKGL